MDLQKIIPAIVLTALFFIGVIIYLIHGHHAYGVTREHPWGLLIAMYIFFVVSSTGLCIVGSFGDVFGFKDYMAVSKRAIFGSIITILSGFAVIAFEIGHPITMMIYNVLSPGLTSAIWWMGTLYGIYLTFMVIEFIFLMRNDMKNAKIFGLFGLLVGLAAHSNLGGVFGFLNARVVANGVFYPTYFILTAFITGIYLIFLMYGYKYRGKPFPEDVTKALINFMKIQGLLLRRYAGTRGCHHAHSPYQVVLAGRGDVWYGHSIPADPQIQRNGYQEHGMGFLHRHDRYLLHAI